MDRYDIIVAGAGMVGATLAAALGDRGFRLALLDGQVTPARWTPRGVDLRTSAITRASENVFRGVGAWEGMASRRVCPFQEMRVWDERGFGEIHFDSADIGEPVLGHIIENSVATSSLMDRLAELHDVTVLWQESVVTLARFPDRVELTTTSGRRVAAPLVVGADGVHSLVRRLANVTTGGWVYPQKAVVATVATERFHAHTAWQRFLTTGPVAFLPMHDGLCSIVWSTTSDQAQRLLDMEEAEFSLALAEALQHRLGTVELRGARAAFPLRLQYAHEYVKPRIALVGDAAHTVHPLAGQGANLGIMDAAALVQVVLEAYAGGGDIGSSAVLRRYERWRKGDNLAVMAAMDAFKRGFGTSLRPVRWLRNAGLAATQRLGPVKNAIMHRAMGLAGDLPPLACGRFS